MCPNSHHDVTAKLVEISQEFDVNSHEIKKILNFVLKD